VKTLRSFVIRFGGSNSIKKSADMNGFPFASLAYLNLSNPAGSCCTPVDTFEFASRSQGVLRTVSTVLTNSALAKIFSAVVQGVMVLVIDVQRIAWSEAKDFSSHVYRRVLFATCRSSYPASDKTPGLRAPVCVPVPFRERVKILGVDDCVLSSRKGYKAVRFIQWLRNGMPHNSAFRHESSLIGLVQRSHFNIGGALSHG
jgi:hypothetical protein